MSLKDIAGALVQSVRKRLTIEQEHVAAVAGVLPKRCATCARFDLAAGQEMLAKDTRAAALTAALTPTQWSAASRNTLKINTEDGAFVDAEAPVPAASDEPTPIERWGKYGACSKYQELVSADRKCTPGDENKQPQAPCVSWI